MLSPFNIPDVLAIILDKPLLVLVSVFVSVVVTGVELRVKNQTAPARAAIPTMMASTFIYANGS